MREEYLDKFKNVNNFYTAEDTPAFGTELKKAVVQHIEK